MLQYQIIPVTPFQQNCSLIWDDTTMEGALVDPGGDVATLMAAVEDKGVKLTKLLLTHAHIDHAGGTAVISREQKLPIIGPHKEDLFWIEGLPQQAQMFGFPNVETFQPDQWLEAGDKVTVGTESLDVIYTPGHTPGHVVFYHPEQQLCWVGDVIFQGSVGRSDFPKGDHATLIASIKEKLLPLGDDVQFVPGHGPMSNFGYEKKTNPFLQ